MVACTYDGSTFACNGSSSGLWVKFFGVEIRRFEFDTRATRVDYGYAMGVVSVQEGRTLPVFVEIASADVSLLRAIAQWRLSRLGQLELTEKYEFAVIWVRAPPLEQLWMQQCNPAPMLGKQQSCRRSLLRKQRSWIPGLPLIHALWGPGHG